MFSWFDKFLAAMWIFFMFFFTAGLAFGHTATVRFLDAQAGLLTVQVGEGTRWIQEQIVKGFVKPVEVRAFGLSDLGSFLVKAAVRLLKKLLDSVFGVFRRLLDKAADFIRQFASMVNSSQGAFDLLSIVGGRKSICGVAGEIIQDFFNQIDIAYMSPWEYAWTQTQRWTQQQVDSAYAFVTGQPAYAQQTFADQCNFTIFDGNLDAVSLDQPVLPGLNTGSSSSSGFGSTNDNIATTKRFTEAAVYKIADAASTGKSTQNLKNSVANVVQQQAQEIGFTNQQCNELNRDFAWNLFLFNRCTGGGGDGATANSQTQTSLDKIADTAKQGAAASNASFSQNAKPGSTVAIKDSSKVRPEDKIVPLVSDANVRFSTDPRSLTESFNAATQLADFVGDPKRAVIVEPVTDAQQNLNQAMNSVDRKANSGSGGEDDGDLLKQIQEQVLQFLEQYALQLLNELTDSASFIACGVLNFDGFCNSVTMASGNLERDINNFFQRRQSQINSASLKTDSVSKFALYGSKNYLGFQPEYSTV